MKLKEEEHIKWAVREAAAAKTGRNVAVSFLKKKRLNDDHRVLFSLIYRHTYIQVYTYYNNRSGIRIKFSHTTEKREKKKKKSSSCQIRVPPSMVEKTAQIQRENLRFFFFFFYKEK